MEFRKLDADTGINCNVTSYMTASDSAGRKLLTWL